MKISGLHLGVSASAIIIVGLFYGINPNRVLPIFFDFKVESTDLTNVFRSIMGLYFGLAVFWIIGIVKEEVWKGATLSNIMFMGGLSMGRVISLVIDGPPSSAYQFGMAAEILFLVWGIYNLNHFPAKKK